MRRLLPILILLTWALWLGGLITLFMAVNSLFDTFDDRTTAGLAATGIFRRFESFQLILAAVLLASLIGWRLVKCSKFKRFALILVMLATIGAVTSTTYISPRIDALRIEGRTKEPAFRKLHGLAMTLYLGQTLLLVVAGVMLPAAMRQPE